MEKDKLKLNKKDTQFFLIPFIILVILIGMMTYTTSKNQIKEILLRVENSTLNIVDSYSKMLINSKEALDIISNLLDEKIIVASQAVLLISDNETNISMTELAEKFEVDQINLYSNSGEIISSNVEEYLGWKATEGHSVYNFILSNETVLVEDIRQDTENGLFYKYGYVKRDDNTFVQIGVLAENIQLFTEGFGIKEFIKEIVAKDNVEDAFFIDTNFKVMGSSIPEYTGILIEDKETQEHLSQDKISSNKDNHGSEDLHVCTPIFYGDEKLGTLSIIWVSDIISDEIRKLVLSGIIEIIILIIIIGIILYYAYRKNKSNLKAAYYDSLTGLPNNKYLQDYLGQVVKNSGRSKKAILLINGTNFKILNMIYSFKYGDYILKQIANQIKSLLNPADMIFRFNGDRFVVVIDDYMDSRELESIAKEIVDIFNKVAYDEVKHEYFKAEISIVEIQDENILVDKVLRNATHALTYLNPDINNQIIFYNKDIEIKAKRENVIEKALTDIIQGKDNESFYLEFQPKLDVKTNKIMGFEALARLNIQGLGNIPPIEFINLAERRMLIYDLGKIILEKACGFSKKLKNSGHDNISVAINISVIQLLSDEFVEDVKRYVIESGTDVKSLEFEITESVIIDNFDFINKKLEKIRNFGITISLDDFGTGFSSFSRLSDLKIDTVKIDKFFIDRVLIEKEENLISTDIISMAHKIGLTVVAEGVEEEKQRKYFEKYDCDIIQGYLISKPLGEEIAIKFLETKNKKDF